MNKALKELYAIIKTPDWTDFCPEKIRAELLDKWRDKWVEQVEQSQLVVDKQYLDSEHLDVVICKLAQDASEVMAENCTEYKIEDRKITAKIVAIRRKSK